MVDLLVLTAVMFVFGLVSRRLEGTLLKAPIAFVAAGIVFGPAVLGLAEVGLDEHTVLLVGEIALVIVLFTEAARINLTVLLRNRGLPLRLLGIGMPLTIALGTTAAALLLTDLAFWEAAFVGGLAAGPTVERVGERLIRFTEAEGQLLNLSVFFIFGILVIGVIGAWSWEVLFYVLLSLTVIRMLPVALSLIGTHLGGISGQSMGWFGPRGLASIVLGLIVVEEAPLLGGRDEWRW